jgi:hypothetical protein
VSGSSRAQSLLAGECPLNTFIATSGALSETLPALSAGPMTVRVTLRTLTHLEGVPEGISMGFFGWTRESTAEHYTQLKKVAEQTVPMAKSIDKILGLATPLFQKQSGQPTDGGEAEP